MQADCLAFLQFATPTSHRKNDGESANEHLSLKWVRNSSTSNSAACSWAVAWILCARASPAIFANYNTKPKNDEKLLTRWANKIRESCDQQNPPPASTWGNVPNIAQQSGLIYISVRLLIPIEQHTQGYTQQAKGGKIPECHWHHTNLTFHPKWSVMSLLNSYIFLLICELSHIAPKMGWFSISIPDLQSVVIWHKTLEPNLTMSNVPGKTWQVDRFETFRQHLGMVPLQQLSRALQEMPHVQGPKKALHSAPFTKLHSTQPWNCSRRNWLWWKILWFLPLIITWWVMSPGVSWGYPLRVYLCLSSDILGHYLRDTWKYLCLGLKWLVSHCWKAWKGRTCITLVLKQPPKMSLERHWSSSWNMSENTSPTSIAWHGGMKWKLAVGHARSFPKV